MQNPLPGRQNRAADDANIDHTVPPGMFSGRPFGRLFFISAVWAQKTGQLS